MITIVSLVNICYHAKLQMFFLVVKTIKIHSLSNFQISITVLLTIMFILYIISHELCIISNLYTLSSEPPEEQFLLTDY